MVEHGLLSNLTKQELTRALEILFKKYALNECREGSEEPETLV